jgi:CDP-diacylglycerol--glycerol-3-phosphate 3-phosphatidyltransferase
MIPNLLTILRAILTIVLIWIYYDGVSELYTVLSITILIFMTDIFDGKLARKLHSETKAGEIMDVLTDMGYVFAMSVIMSRMSIISDYFLILVCAEFLIFVATSRFLKDENRYLIFDVAGRILAVVYYVTPIVMYISFMKFTTIHRILLEYGFMTLVIFTFVVVIYRLSLCVVTENKNIYLTNK